MERSMREFFHGWRRKAGCMTLVMACVFAVGWVRSEFKFDNISMIHEGKIESFFSVTQHLGWTSESTNSGKTGMRWNSENLIIGEDGLPRWNADRSDLPVEGLGLAQGDGWAAYRYRYRERFDGKRSDSQILIHYGAITVPLAILCVYLLLWKPRKRAP
jgi:hypothetical protein